jgi:hypothetical protein
LRIKAVIPELRPRLYFYRGLHVKTKSQNIYLKVIAFENLRSILIGIIYNCIENSELFRKKSLQKSFQTILFLQNGHIQQHSGQICRNLKHFFCRQIFNSKGKQLIFNSSNYDCQISDSNREKLGLLLFPISKLQAFPLVWKPRTLCTSRY